MHDEARRDPERRPEASPVQQPPATPAWELAPAPRTALHVLAVSTAISTMAAGLDRRDTLTLALRRSGYSPYHFRRLFRVVTGTPPGRFLTALRMQAAKTALATSDRQVSTICYDVGYQSLGAFTTQFTRLVGITPGRFRRLVDAAGGRTVPAHTEGPSSTKLRGPAVALNLMTVHNADRHQQPDDAPGLILTEDIAALNFTAVVGLFASDIAQGVPVSHVMLHDHLTGHLEVALPAGRHDLFAVAFPAGTTLIDLALDQIPGSVVGHRRFNITASHPQPDDRLVVHLRSRRHTDPPIVSSAAAIHLLSIADVRP